MSINLRSGLASEIHGFHCDIRPDYRADEAADAWKRALDWFASHLA